MKTNKGCITETAAKGTLEFGKVCVKEANDFLDNIRKVDEELEYKTKAINKYKEKWIISGYIKYIDLLNMLSEGLNLPQKIKYNNIIYTNLSRTRNSLLYICLFDNILLSESTKSFKEAIYERNNNESDFDILNREIGVEVW